MNFFVTAGKCFESVEAGFQRMVFFFVGYPSMICFALFLSITCVRLLFGFRK